VSNVRRLQHTDHIFFVTVNFRRGVAQFEEDEFPLMIAVLEASRRRLGFALCGYVLMPDHWHALLWPFQPVTISQVIHDMKKISALRLHQHRKTSGPFWQHQFWDRFVRHAKEFSERLEYMHFNPVLRGLVESPGQWRWSSFNNFGARAGEIAGCPITIDYVDLSDQYRA
jgi:putative transposase